MLNFRFWPMSVLDPKRKYTADRYQVVQSNDSTIGILRGVKERTFTAALALQDSVEGGIVSEGIAQVFNDVGNPHSHCGV